MTGPHELSQNVTTNRIREWRKRRHMTQGDLAAALDTSVNTISQFELGKRDLSLSWLRRFAAVLKVSPADLTHDGLAAPQVTWRGPEGLARHIAGSAGRRAVPDDGIHAPDARTGQELPLFTTRPRGDGAGTIGIIWGQAMEFVTRPPGLAGAASAYCIYMQGNAMSPRLAHGERIYISPTRPATVGDDVVILLDDPNSQQADGTLVTAHVGRLVRADGDMLVITHFCPAAEYILDTTRIAAMHRIYPTSELLGF